MCHIPSIESNCYRLSNIQWYSYTLQVTWTITDVTAVYFQFFTYLYTVKSLIQDRTKSQNLNVSWLGLQLPSHNILKPSVQWRMKMQLKQHRQAMLQLHLSDQPFHCLLKCILYYRLDGRSYWTIRSSDNDSTGFWPRGSLHTLGADGHI